MPDDRRAAFVDALIAQGASDDAIRAALKAFDTQPAAAAPQADASASSWPQQMIRRAATNAGDMAIGIGKGAVRSAIGMADTAAQSRMIPGVNPGAAAAAVQRFTPEYTNDAQRVGGALETAAEVLPGAVSVARAVPGLAREGMALLGGTRGATAALKAGTSDTSFVTQARQFAVRKLIGRSVELAAEKAAAKAPAAAGRSSEMVAAQLPRTMPRAESFPAPPPNAGGRLVKGVGKNVDTVIADALEELRAPAPPSRVELPPPAQLQAGYTPRASAPAPTPAAAPPVSAPPAAARVAFDAPAAEPAAPPKRAYFLRSPEETAAASRAATEASGPRPYFTRQVEPAATPTKGARRELTLDDLPESWRSRVGDVAPPSGIAGQDYAKAAADVLSETGVSAQEAILAVSRNPSLPPGVRLQLVSALKRAGGIK